MHVISVFRTRQGSEKFWISIWWVYDGYRGKDYRVIIHQISRNWNDGIQRLRNELRNSTSLRSRLGLAAFEQAVESWQTHGFPEPEVYEDGCRIAIFHSRD